MKKIISILLASAMTLSLCACGGGNQGGGSQTGGQSNSSQGSGSAANQGGIDKSQELVIYTNSGSDGRDAWLIEKAAEAGYKVQVLPLGASEVTNRLIAEKNNAIADIVFGQNNIEYEKLVAQDLLLEWKPDWTDGVDLTLTSNSPYYYPVSTTPLLLIYNNELSNPPSDWTDLTKPEYKGLYQLHGLNGGTGKTVLASIITRYRDPNGELGISDEGWNVAKEYLGNCHLITSGEDSIGAIIDGSLPMDMHWASGVITEQRDRNYKFGIMTPEIGEPFVVESLAIVKTTRNPDLAVDFLNWFGSAEVQLAWSDAWGTIPAHKDALEGVSDDIKEMMSVLTPQELDWAFIAENMDAWAEKCELEYVQ